MGATYSKHKDCLPEQTVERITSILEHMGIETEVMDQNHPFDGACSNRIKIPGTEIGAYGKGATEAYALASGYGELMERMQNGFLAQRRYHAHLHTKCGFYHYRDEKLVSVDDLLDEPSGLVNRLLEQNGIENREKKMQLLSLLPSGRYGRDDGRTPVVPYVDVFSGEQVWLPPTILLSICGSNGLAAGNTMEEALVQGLSEIFRHYAQNTIIENQLTPPAVPSAYLKLPGIRETIRAIERGRRYRVSVYDCSLGRGYPVVATLVADTNHGTFGMWFGSHPSFAVAVEQAITEAYQARTAKQSASAHRIAPYKAAIANISRVNLARGGGGLYPVSILGGKPSWEFTPWDDTEGQGNQELLARMLDLLRHEGRQVLVRDNSHVGFPAYSIVVPGMSEIMRSPLLAKQNAERIIRAFGSFPNVSDEEEELMLQTARKVVDLDDLTKEIMFARPLASSMMQPARVLGFLYLKRGDFEPAAKWFKQMAKTATIPQISLYWTAVANYAKWRSWGTSREDAFKLMKKLYPALIWRKIKVDVDPKNIIRLHFLPMKCRDDFKCDDCEMGRSGLCLGKAELALYERIREAMAKSEVSQTELAQALRPYVGD